MRIQIADNLSSSLVGTILLGIRRQLRYLGLASLVISGACAGQDVAHKRVSAQNNQVLISFRCGKGCLWQYGTANSTRTYKFAPPSFSIGDKQIVAEVHYVIASGDRDLGNGVTEYSFEGRFVQDRHLRLGIQIQINNQTPMIRFRYTVECDQSRLFSTPAGRNSLVYLKISLRQLPILEEVSLSNFSELTHSYTLSEQRIEESYFKDGGSFMGPILAATDGKRSFLLAYEHGSQVPDAFLHYQLDSDRSIRLTAVKGNYVSGQAIEANRPYRTVWLEAGAVQGGIDQLASTYRLFVLRFITQNLATRTPYIFYNTWNFQERNKWWNGRPYLESMNEERVLKEIDVAHRMGVDVYVLDTGWYEKTGDWTVSRRRFPGGLKNIKAKLDGYGMQLGLWFGPTSAAMSSRMVREHPEWRMSWNGVIPEPNEVWETEKSHRMCMVSGYADAFADELIRLAKEVGVTYFKLDAIDQYGCNDPHHSHGDARNSPQERADSYGFQLVQSLSHVANKVAAAVPGAIVDYDVTEGDRAMGLGFLSSGKYFLMNNGPYFQSYDVPIDVIQANSNLFFYQGQARTWIARSPLTFDKWIPSVLFLTHYFPDDPRQWQEVDIASLILGQNGIWGDLLNVSDPGIAFVGGMLARYKQVRDDITESDPFVTGIVSGSPETHEKISSATGRGVVVVFSTEKGTFNYITKQKVADRHWADDGVTVSQDALGRATIKTLFNRPGAKIIFFGVQ